jgi:hypothetical protein
MKKYYRSAILLALILALGFLIPIGSYTTVRGCPVEPTPRKRLHVLFGDSLEKIKRNDVAPPPNAGCPANTKYTLYLL